MNTLLFTIQSTVIPNWKKSHKYGYLQIPQFYDKLISCCVRFEVFTAVTMKNGVFWDVTPCGILARATLCNIPEDNILYFLFDKSAYQSIFLIIYTYN
jgi:hypothetical protein